MCYYQPLCGICLFCCSFSVVFSEDDFDEIEKVLRYNPPGFGQGINEATINHKKSKNIIHNELDEQFSRVKKNPANILNPQNSPIIKDAYLKIDKDGIKVFIYRHKNSKFGTFKATTHIDASVDSILAVLFDSKACMKWLHACDDSFVIEDVSFNERYHYQVIDIPFPFQNRGFILHSMMEQEHDSKVFNITTSVVSGYCKNKTLKVCDQIKNSSEFIVKKSIGSLKLEPENFGTKITWIQHTDPGGNLPSWLVNKFVADTPYWTFKNLSHIVEEEKYKYAKLIYDNQGVAIKLDIPPDEAITRINNFDLFPTF